MLKWLDEPAAGLQDAPRAVERVAAHCGTAVGVPIYIQAISTWAGAPICFIVVALGSFAFSPQLRAACDSPDPGCPGGNLAEGHLALGSLSGGLYNTGIGAYSLLSDSTGSLNTAIGAGALLSNTADQNTATGAGALLSNNLAEGYLAFRFSAELDRQARSSQNWASLNGSESGGGLFPLGSSPPPDPAIINKRANER